MTGVENAGVFIREKVWLENSLSQLTTEYNMATLLAKKMFTDCKLITSKATQGKRIFLCVLPR